MTQLFSTEHGISYQSDEDRCFYVHFQERKIALSVCALIAFRKKVEAIDLVELLTSSDEYSDTAIVSTCHRDAILVLSIREVIELKELLTGTLVMLELNSILHQKLNCGIS